MNKAEYILRSLQKIRHKRWELFIISRIIHKLDDLDVEFVTQQLVRLPNGGRALTDLYFPQFNLHLEIDEPHHLSQKEADRRRSQDIVQSSEASIERIKSHRADGAERTLEEITAEVDAFVKRLILKRDSDQGFEPWEFEKRYDPEKVIAKGGFQISDNVLFRRQIDAMRCFGFMGKGWQKGAWRVPGDRDDWLWFPRLYPHGMWHNEL